MKLPKGSYEYETCFIDINDEDIDVVVVYSVQGDNLCDGGINIEGVWRPREDITRLCSKNQLLGYADAIADGIAEGTISFNEEAGL